VSSFYRDPKRKRKLFNSFYEKRLAGMIVGGSSLDEEYLSRNDHAIPAVLVNSCSYPFSISVDQSLGAQKAMTHLLELGHRQIVYVSQGTPSNTDAMQFNGYCTALREHGIVVDENMVVQERGVLLEASRPSLTCWICPSNPLPFSASTI